MLAPARAARASAIRRQGVLFALLGMAPDIDLLFETHRGPTHSIGAALIAGLAVGAFTRNGRIGAAAAAAYATHILLDWLGADSSVPFGVMALWPFTTDHYLASTHVFDSVWRRNETPDFWDHNIRTVAREVLILLPLAAIAYAWRCALPPEGGSHGKGVGGGSDGKGVK